MDIRTHDEQQVTVAGPAAATLDAASLPLASAPPSADGPVSPPADETVFSVLATRARSRAPAHLWITFAVGAIDAVALMAARPTLWWVAAAFAGVASYAAWGLADRALSAPGPVALRDSKWLGLQGVRGIAIVGGIAATAVTVFGFVGAALGRGTLGW